MARWSRGEGEGPYPAGGVGYLRLARLSRLATRALSELARGLGLGVVGELASFLRKNWDHFFGGDAPRSSPRGWLGFLGKAKLPFNFMNLLIVTSKLPTRVLGM
jgi:hypothetical protein